MKIALPPVIQAPLSTGHPWSLPQIRKPKPEIAPLNPAGTALGNGAFRASDVPRPTAWARETELAPPPSAIQIEIETLLAKQAEKLDRQAQDQDANAALLRRPAAINRD